MDDVDVEPADGLDQRRVVAELLPADADHRARPAGVDGVGRDRTSVSTMKR